MKPPQIAPLERRHLRAVMRIDGRSYPEPWSRKLWSKELDRRDRIYLVAVVDDAVVGYAGALLAVDDVHVTTIATDPAWHRQGIGTALLHGVVTRAIALGASALTLEVRAGNTAAQALYRAFGLAPAGVRRGYYQPDNEDALVMWAHDINSPEYASRLAALGPHSEVKA